MGVGGTSLHINGTSGNYTWGSEESWGYGSDSYCPSCGSGGGISNTYKEPSWQEGVQSYGQRTIPDVSADANPSTGVPVYDPANNPAGEGWEEVGGTSLASPLWAGFIAIANQGRVLDGGKDLGGPSVTLPALYSLPYSSDFHDITAGFGNPFTPTVGYDLVTGLGTPVGNLLIPDLAAYGLATQAAVTIQPPSTVIADGQFGLQLAAETANGGVDSSFTGTAEISIESGPSGGTLSGTTTVSFSDGLAVFDGLSLDQLSNGTDYTLSIQVFDQNGQLFDTITSDPINVATAATSGIGVFYPLPLDSSLHRDVNLADSNSDPTDILYLVYPTAFALSSGELVVENTSALTNKSISIIGQGENASIITANQTSRVFDIVDTSATQTLSVLFQNLSIEGGLATDDAGLNLPQTVVGGGLVINGGDVTMSNVAVKSNVAAGVNGTSGSAGNPGAGGPGGNGTSGGHARGGGFFMASGSLTLNNDTIIGNTAKGGNGGAGGSGGAGYTFTFDYNPFTDAHTGGAGGHGGNGGVATGGGAYVAHGGIVLSSDVFQSNQAVGGSGGRGGNGGHGGFFSKPGGPGGDGGNGAAAFGGGIFISGGTLSLTATSLTSNAAVGGPGGAGGFGGTGGTTSQATSSSIRRATSGASGVAGLTASGNGGGIYLFGGLVTWNSVSIEANQATNGAGIFNEGQILSLAGAITIANNVGFSGAGGGGGAIWSSARSRSMDLHCPETRTIMAARSSTTWGH